MASIVQSATGGADGTNTSATAALARSATVGALLTAALAVDKNAGSVPRASAGWTVREARASSSITLAVATRVADGTSADQCAWSWTTGMPYAWWIAETDLDASAGIDTAVTWTDESAVATISLGPATAPGDGLAVAFVAVDTLSNWLSGGRAATWTDSFAEVAAPTTPSNDCCMSIATVAVRDGASVSTRATSASGGRDQASGVLLVIGEASEASGSTEIETIGEITAAGTKHATGTTDIAAVAELTATGVKHAVGTVTIEVVAEVTASGEPGTTEPVLAARVVSQPVDDQLVVTITHSSGRKSRWGGDEPDASGIPQGISTKTSAPGGFQDASMSLVRDPRLDWPDMRLVDHVEIAGNTRPLGRAAFEGQMDAFPAQLADAFSIGAEVIGYQCMLEDDESWSQVYIDRELSRFQGPRAQRQLDLIDSNRPHQGDATASWDTDSSVPALVLAVNGSWEIGRAHV